MIKQGVFLRGLKFFFLFLILVRMHNEKSFCISVCAFFPSGNMQEYTKLTKIKSVDINVIVIDSN